MKLKKTKDETEAKERTTEERLEEINSKVLNEHERLVNKLKSCEPNSDEYDAVLKELKEFESIQREKDKTNNSDKNSKREHIGKTLITSGATLLATISLMGVEKSVPITGKTAQNFISSIFRRK